MTARWGTGRPANHIPLIVKPPGSEDGPRVEDALTGTTDIFATILDYAGLPLPSCGKSSGRSVRPLIERTGLQWEDAVFMEQEETRAIRTRRWLLMRRFRPTPYDFGDELYDLESDPDERRNIAGDRASQADLAELSARIDAFFSRYSDARWDLWRGGTVKSNSTRPFLWREVWGEDWTTVGSRSSSMDTSPERTSGALSRRRRSLTETSCRPLGNLLHTITSDPRESLMARSG